VEEGGKMKQRISADLDGSKGVVEQLEGVIKGKKKI
jgi:hypothetical protein